MESKKKLIGGIIAGMVIVIIAIIIVVISFTEKLTTVKMLYILEPASDLVVTKEHYESIETFEGESTQIAGVDIPFTKEETWIHYSGTIHIGFDISDIDFEINQKNKTITFTMPEPKIIAHEIDKDSIESHTVKNAIFKKTSYEEYSAFISECQKKKEEETMKNKELLQRVDENAEKAIKSLLADNKDTKKYQVIFE